MVEEAYVSYSIYDLIIKIRTDSIGALKESVTNRLRTINGVLSPRTLILMESPPDFA